jgi:hypothetical protein
MKGNGRSVREGSTYTARLFTPFPLIINIAMIPLLVFVVRLVVFKFGICFPEGKIHFCLLRNVQTGPEAHPASYTLDAMGSFPGGKAARE